jgi:hypothetical protein
MTDVFVQRTAEQAVARQLGQSQAGTVTTAASLYTPGDGIQAVVKRIIICNTTGGNAAFDIFHDDDGTTYDATTQLYKDNTVTAGLTRVIEDELFVDSSGNIAVASDVTAALTFTIYGEEVQIRAR